MNALRLALRNVLLGPPRARTATLLIAAGLCALDLFAGHVASERARLEYQAVVGERLGHLAITRDPSGAARAGFDAAEVARIQRIAVRVKDVTLVVPQIHLTGVASTGRSSAVFSGAGIGPVPVDAPVPVRDQPGLLGDNRGNGIAVSSGQARSLGLRNGSPLTLTGVAPDAPPIPVNTQVVDIFNPAGFNASARTVLMPLGIAQTLLETANTERLAVYLSNPRQLEQRGAALADALRRDGLAVQVRAWRELSTGYARAEAATNLALLCVSGTVLALVWATLAATLVIDTHARRGELAALRALGMRRRTVVAMVAAEALWISLFGAALSLAASGLIAWVLNRAALSYGAQPSLSPPPMPVELDFDRMQLALAALLAVALLAALPAGFSAARVAVARGLRGEHGHPGW
jgi:putative ABC transport system permease protein